MSNHLKVGNSPHKLSQSMVRGKFVDLLEDQFYCIENYDQMPPFFMSLVSSSDHWMFISSTGGLTAGRINAESALFPYQTDDKVCESSQTTGPISIFHVTRDASTSLWEPLSNRCTGLYTTERKIYKNVIGNILIFEETNQNLGLTYRQAWRSSDQYGFVLTIWLQNNLDTPVEINLLSGVQNILPFGTTSQLQNTFSNLLNAYKRSELETETGLGIFSLSSTISDLAEPSESLKASTVWQVGLDHPAHLLSSLQVSDFRKGDKITTEEDIRGYRGAYLLNKSITLDGGETTKWSLVLDVNQDSADIVKRINMLKRPPAEIETEIESDIAAGSAALKSIIASADGLQLSNDQLSSAHHFANVLFNTMRGGIFANHYQIDKSDLIDFLNVRNLSVTTDQKGFLDQLPDEFNLEELLSHARASQDPDLERLCLAYLPLTFSRRHGDPSRPWNRFSINLKNPDGSQRLDYQGNWRDLFQNWEALACSYPEFVESMVSIFVNAGTPDGYNPYRVTRAGIEWEEPEPNNPWSNIGYWSDHQIIYLQKLLELSNRFHPGKLGEMLNRRIFSYANVPYRMKDYASLVEDPYNTIDFDYDLHRQIAEQAARFGTDKKLVHSQNDEIFHVTLNEKLLVPLLAKLVNFVPEGGIWMNTQRPEWNDANNALVGKGLSVVTLGYLRRYVVFWQTLLDGIAGPELTISREVKTLYQAIRTILEQFTPALDTSFSDEERREMMDLLGEAGSEYRWQIYLNGFSGDFESTPLANLRSFLNLTNRYIEHALRTNQGKDGLYHAYNILKLEQDTAEIGRLYEMLEGQVSILSSGMLSPEEGLNLLQKLRKSALYRTDQHSYILYPDRELPRFTKKNLLPAKRAEGIDLIQALVADNEQSLVLRDENGEYHFNGSFHNAKDVQRTLDQLAESETYTSLVNADREKVLALFEEVFNHDTFTGRSGTFFAYEGLGSIYWHMVSKLLLAAQENLLLAIQKDAGEETIQALTDCYYDIRMGIGFNKSPEVFGAFPTDPYSHTPKGQGAKQPGMTGQVKEEILTRLVEMGVFVENGQIIFDPVILHLEEFLPQPAEFEYIALDGSTRRISLPAGSLAFTFCQTPVIYQLNAGSGLEMHFSDGRVEQISGYRLDQENSRHIFKRDGVIKKIYVALLGQDRS